MEEVPKCSWALLQCAVKKEFLGSMLQSTMFHQCSIPHYHCAMYTPTYMYIIENSKLHKYTVLRTHKMILFVRIGQKLACIDLYLCECVTIYMHNKYKFTNTHGIYRRYSVLNIWGYWSIGELWTRRTCISNARNRTWWQRPRHGYADVLCTYSAALVAYRTYVWYPGLFTPWVYMSVAMS